MYPAEAGITHIFLNKAPASSATKGQTMNTKKEECTDGSSGSDANRPSPESTGQTEKSGKDAVVAGSSSLVTVSAGNAIMEDAGTELSEQTLDTGLSIEREEIVHVIISPDQSAIVLDDSRQVSHYQPVWEVLKVFLIPAMILVSIVVGIVILGLAQRTGWLPSGTGDASANASSADAAVSYICPMMCVPPQGAPGRCPVCGMELVLAASNASAMPSSTIQIDSRSRRVSGIKTAVAQTRLLIREIRGVGEISYDESKLKTLSAYIDGRIEELYADYTGVEVKQGDSLALLYSPELYAAQVEYLQTIESAQASVASASSLAPSNARLKVISRERLVELGMTEAQIEQLEKGKTANRRLELHAPVSGTVIEKLAVTGQYLKAGAPVYRLADLSTVWLVLELFPNDASSIRIGQQVTATTQSMPNEIFEGEVEFIEPTVDPGTRTVGIRVAMSNPGGRLKPGEFARASLKVPVLSVAGESGESVVIPRNSLLSVGQHSLAYVEIKPGEYEIRKVTVGPTVDDMVAILSGIQAGENVVAQSTFLLDAQMQLQGNPSLIDPDKMIMPELDEEALEEIRLALEPLSDEDRKLAEQQVICPVTEARLGSLGMGTPIKMEVNGRSLFICCEGCRKGMLEETEKYFRILDDYAAGKTTDHSSHTEPGVKQPATEKNELPQMKLPQMKLPQMKLPGQE